MFTKAKGNFVGVAAANDGLGGAVASVLAREGATKDIPTTGQDATDEGLQRVLLGTQCMTVYKAIKKEADAAAELAIALAKGDTAAADQQASGSVEDTETGEQVKSVLLEPQAIFPENVKDVIADGFTTADKICTSAELKKACEENGITG
jgi:D-xylose transport system substrate-binding protein